MKKILFIAAFLISGYTAQSQVLLSLIFGDKLNSEGLEFGLEGGVNWSSIANLESNDRLSSFNLGFYFDIRLKNQWNLYTGVLVKAKHGNDKLTASDLEFLGIEPFEANGTYSQKLNYFMVPALIKYNFENRIYAELGPQFGLMYDGWVEFNSDENGQEAKIKTSNDDNINKFDVGVTIGTGYRLRPVDGMTLGIKYYYGFTNVYEGISGSNNSSLFLKMNIPIGANKKKKEPDTDTE